VSPGESASTRRLRVRQAPAHSHPLRWIVDDRDLIAVRSTGRLWS
jgi:hypothetical protein